MTQQELKNLFRSTLQAQRTIAQEYTVLDAIVDFIAQALTTGIPDWGDALTFQTDGSDAGSFAIWPDTNGNIRFWKTKTDDNINNEPPTNPATTETTDWIEVSPSDGSSIKEWAAGIYGAGLVIVYHNHSTDGRGLYILLEPTRPYESTNIETEITAGDWELIGDSSVGGGGHEIKEGGTPLTQRAGLNFDGDDFNLTDDSGNDETDVSINSSKWATRSYAESLVTGLWDDRGSFDASGGAYPSGGGSGIAGAILKGDIWIISVAGTLPTGQVVEVGDLVRALVDTPGNTQANWAITQNNIGYVAANDSAVVHNTGAENVGGVKTFTSDPIVPDEVYGPGWNGSLEIPTKNAVYDKIETLSVSNNLFLYYNFY